MVFNIHRTIHKFLHMMTIASSPFNDFELFYCGNDEKFMDDMSFGASEDSYDSFTTNESYNSSSSTSGDEQHQSKKKQKFHRNAHRPLPEHVDLSAVKDWEIQQAFVAMPRLIKTDVRRSYSSIFQNVVNIQSFPLMFEFLKQYCVPSIIHMQPDCREKDEYKGSVTSYPEKFFKMVGTQTVAQFWFNHMYILPDVIYKLLDTKVHTYSHTLSSKVVSTFNMSATRLVELPFESVFPTLTSTTRSLDGRDTTTSSVFVDSFNNTTGDATGNASTVKGKKRSLSSSPATVDMSMISDRIISLISTAPLLATPEYCSQNITLTMHLDANKFIERMEFEMVL